jgi:cobalt/nickel transport system permease protein
MHMADALVSPAVGATMWVATAGLIGLCARRVRQALDDGLVPRMGVLGAFIFAAQMINFSIPGTGSSGHLGGGLILAVLLGPYAAFVVIASVLTVQALFFADGGLLALGCNIFNLGVFPAFIAFPLIYRPITGAARGGGRLWTGSLLAAVVGLQLGAFGVVLETALSGISDLPFRTFVLLMQPIHLAIGVAEGLATAAVVGFVLRSRPESLEGVACGPVVAGNPRRVVAGLLVAAVMVAGGVSWFASTRPDGLEWAMAKTSGRDVLARPVGSVHARLAAVQEKTAFLPDYGFSPAAEPAPGAAPGAAAEVPARWPAVSAGTSTAGLVGGLIVLVIVGLCGYALRKWRTAA